MPLLSTREAWLPVFEQAHSKHCVGDSNVFHFYDGWDMGWCDGHDHRDVVAVVLLGDKTNDNTVLSQGIFWYGAISSYIHLIRDMI